MEKKWYPTTMRPKMNEVILLKAEIVIQAKYQPTSTKKEWVALDEEIEELTILGWHPIYGKNMRLIEE